RHDWLVALPTVLNLHGRDRVMTPPMPLLRTGRTALWNGHLVIAGSRSVYGKRLSYAAHPKRTGAEASALSFQRSAISIGHVADRWSLTADGLFEVLQELLELLLVLLDRLGRAN